MALFVAEREELALYDQLVIQRVSQRSLTVSGRPGAARAVQSDQLPSICSGLDAVESQGSSSNGRDAVGDKRLPLAGQPKERVRAVGHREAAASPRQRSSGRGSSFR